MEISNEELFDSALNDAPLEVADQVIEGETEGETVARDEQGRFASKEEATEKPKPEGEQLAAKPAGEQKEDAVPSWRLRELREERDALRAQLAQVQRAPPQPKEPQAKPDIFEKPDEFVRSNVQEAVAPLQKQFSTFIESVSRRDAVREHGQERVSEAFTALDQAANSGDPQALAVVQAVKQSMDPFGDIVSWYRGNEASRNPEGFFQRRLEEALKDEKFKGELLTKLQPEEKPEPVFQIPPKLGRAASAAAALAEGGDLSNESLFENAMR